MEILYIIGNGFDLAQNMKTGFSDFLSYYKEKKPDDSSVISSLKETICKEGIETWADFELKFGEYCGNFANVDEFQDVMDNILDCLEAYLGKEQGLFAPTEELSKKIISDFVNPFQYLKDADTTVIQRKEPLHINVVTFNYTNSLEKIFVEKFPYTVGGKAIRFERLIHVHGILDNTILFGVNDDSQILNKELAGSEVVRYELIKPVANDGMRNTINVNVSRLIGNSDLIVLFGTSIGKTDNKWWTLLSEHLRRYPHTRLIYFVKSNNYRFNQKRANLYGLECERQLKDLCEKLRIPERDSETRSGIVICPNSGIFLPNNSEGL